MSIVKKLFLISSWRHSDSELAIYTDGSAKGAWGSWAYVCVRHGRCLRENSGRVRKSGNNAMEFQAAIEALGSLPAHSKATVYSDSRILVDAMTLGQSPLVLEPQIKILFELSDRHSISWKWVRAHAGLEFNERCDQLCVLARES